MAKKKTKKLQPLKHPQVSPAEAAAELLARKQARTNLIDFCQYTKPDYDPKPMHRLICDKLEAVYRGEIRRLLFMLPPRSGKTEAIRQFVPWAIGQNPKLTFFGIGYGDDFVEAELGRPTRNKLLEARYKTLFPHVELAKDAQGIADWQTKERGGLKVAGAGSAITGRGAQIIIIDDPVKNEEEATSFNAREKLWQWFWGDVYTRLEPYEGGPGAIVGIMTRRHDDDLLGRLIKQERALGTEGWDLVELPALAKADDPLGRDPGQSIWEERFPQEYLENIRRSHPRIFESLYQQDPLVEEGLFFKEEDLRYYETAPDLDTLRVYMTSDYATREDEGDYTVHMVFGVDPEDRIYILDVWRKQARSMEWIEAAIDLAQQYRPMLGGEERGQILGAVGPFLEKRIRERKVYWPRQQYAPKRDKATRARAIQGRLQMNMVYLPANAEWKDELVLELLRFPDPTAHDDQVDCLSLLGQMLEDVMAGTVRPAQREESYTEPQLFTVRGYLDEVKAVREGRQRKMRGIILPLTPRPDWEEMEAA